MSKNLTNLRRTFITDALLDCKKWSTKELKEEINKLQSKYIENAPKITSATLSPILNDLREEGIIITETIPKEERVGRGPGGDRHWLLKNKVAFYGVTKNLAHLIPTEGEFGFFENSEEFYYFGNRLIHSEYGKSMINEDLISELALMCGISLDDNEKSNSLQILKVSPSAITGIVLLSSTLMMYELSNILNEDMDIFKFGEFVEDFMDFLKEYVQKESNNPSSKPSEHKKLELDTTQESRRSLFIMTLYQRLTYDISNPNFQLPYPFEYKTTFTIHPEKKLKDDPSFDICIIP